MRSTLLALGSLIVGLAVGALWGKSGNDVVEGRAVQPARAHDQGLLLAEIRAMRAQITDLSGRLAEQQDSQPAAQDLSQRQDALPKGVVLDTSHVERAVQVLDEYVFRKEHRWWTHNLTRLIAVARANQQKLAYEWGKQWLAALDRANADLQAVTSSDALEKWLSEYRQTIGTHPSEVPTTNLWRDWMMVRYGK